MAGRRVYLVVDVVPFGDGHHQVHVRGIFGTYDPHGWPEPPIGATRYVYRTWVDLAEPWPSETSALFGIVGRPREVMRSSAGLDA